MDLKVQTLQQIVINYQTVIEKTVLVYNNA